MRKVLLYVLLFVCCPLMAHSVKFPGYKYIIVEKLEYGDGSRDKWGVENYILSKFDEMGFITCRIDRIPDSIIVQYHSIPEAFLYCHISHSGVEPIVTMSMNFYNCNKQKIATTSGRTSGHFTMKGALMSVIRSCVYEFGLCEFNIDKCPQNLFSRVEINEVSAREYLDNNIINEIEGIYKTASGNDYLFLVKKNDVFGFDFILLREKDNLWAVGDIKARIEESAVKNFFIGSWFLVNKYMSCPVNVSYENGIITMIGDNFNLQSLKLYPKYGQERPHKKFPPSVNEDELLFSASGSGFLINRQGIIATNNHVIDGAIKIMVVFTDGIDQVEYEAEVVSKDNHNDVALLKIKEKVIFPELPYGFDAKTSPGTEVFTIGFPRPNSMGENYKVTNGIVSSLTGLNDDVREYQITVPIQPGNSGGPLFDMKGNVIGVTTSTLNEEYINAKVENVNYAVKYVYLRNLYEMLPEEFEPLQKKENVFGDLSQKVQSFKNFVCLIKIYQ